MEKAGIVINLILLSVGVYLFGPVTYQVIKHGFVKNTIPIDLDMWF